MAFNPTTDQKNAIEALGSTLVSAAAGSGKTAVLVERVIRKLTDRENPIPADRMLIVTFTNAAALEMRTRIEKRFDEEYKSRPHDAVVARQRQLLSSASICTIDSFCIDLVRENFQKAGVSPDFKISDAASLRAVDEEVALRVLSRCYDSGDADFYTLLDLMNTEYDDKNFRQTILDLYDFSRQLPEPDEWFKSLSAPYGLPFSECPFIQIAFLHAEDAAAQAAELLDAALEQISLDEALAERYAADFSLAKEKLALLAAAATAGDWDGVRHQLDVILPASLAPARGVKSPAVALVKTAWEDFKKIAERMDKIFYDRKEQIEKQIHSLAAPLARLSDILLEFEKELFEEYLERNTLTFHNTEHLALALLQENDSELIGRYDEIMVDEYQDTNDLQDRLFQILSGGERLFVVGDVKQSIYGFRGANPKNFLLKSRAAVPYGKRTAGGMQKVILAENFRSKPQICHAVNFLFSLLMTGQKGGLVYNKEEMLRPAAVYPESALTPVSFDLIEIKANAEESLIAEGRHIAAQIKEIMASPPCIRKDNEALRKAEYSDFAILLRNAGLKAPKLAEVLRREGIPVNLRSEHFASTLEIETFLSLLKVIDNPDSDIDLLTVLSSPIFGFSSEDLTRLRIQKREGSLYSVVVFAAQNNHQHCADFLAEIGAYRRMAAVLPLSVLITRLLDRTDYLNMVTAMENGQARRNNLLLLPSLAQGYSSEHDGGMAGFVEFVKKQAAAGMKAPLSAGNTVRIMTIHASKGLQFPVCILAGVSADFNSNDLRRSIVYSSQGGIGLRYYDEERQEKITTPAREVICEEMRLRAKEEEERLLYVALTRAQDRLMVTYTVSDVEKAVDKMANRLTLFGGRVDCACRFADSFGEWLLAASLLHPDGAVLRKPGGNLIPIETKSRITVSVVAGSSEQSEPQTEAVEHTEDEALVNRLMQNIDYVYPYAELLDIQAKASVTAIANKAESEKYAFSARPAFMDSLGISASERGTAMHKVMQFFDFSKADCIEQEITRLYEWQFITEREAESLNRKALKAFFESEIFGRIKAARLVKREMRFLTEIPAGRIHPALSPQAAKEGIMVQGAVDLCFEEKDGIVILDFKTDRVEKAEDLRAAYAEQLAIYALACEKIWERPVKQKKLYSFALGKAIEV